MSVPPLFERASGAGKFASSTPRTVPNCLPSPLPAPGVSAMGVRKGWSADSRPRGGNTGGRSSIGVSSLGLESSGRRCGARCGVESRLHLLSPGVDVDEGPDLALGPAVAASPPFAACVPAPRPAASRSESYFCPLLVPSSVPRLEGGREGWGNQSRAFSRDATVWDTSRNVESS